MNDNKSKQVEGNDFYDFAVVAYNAGGGVEVAYIAGTNARAAIPLLGAGDAAIWPISETYPVVFPFFPGLACPHDAHSTLLRATSNVLIRLVSRDTVTRWIAALIAGAPFSAWPIPTVQIQLPANTWFTLPDKWALLYVVAQPAQLAGNLIIKASG